MCTERHKQATVGWMRSIHLLWNKLPATYKNMDYLFYLCKKKPISSSQANTSLFQSTCDIILLHWLCHECDTASHTWKEENMEFTSTENNFTLFQMCWNRHVKKWKRQSQTPISQFLFHELKWVECVVEWFFSSTVFFHSKHKKVKCSNHLLLCVCICYIHWVSPFLTVQCISCLPQDPAPCDPGQDTWFRDWMGGWEFISPLKRKQVWPTWDTAIPESHCVKYCTSTLTVDCRTV